MNKSRNYGVDFLRIFLIILILFHHTMLRGTVCLRNLETGTFDRSLSIFAFLNCFTIVAVNCFFLISGYFGIKKNYHKLIKLVISVYLIYGIINIISILSGAQTIDGDLVIGLIFPLSQYWFVFVYLIFACITPYLEQLLDSISVKEHVILTVILVAVFCGYAFLIDNPTIGANRGYSLSFALVLYVIGNLLRKNKIIKPRFYFFCGYIIASILNGILVILAIKFEYQTLAWKLFSYNNPFVLLGSISLLKAFDGLGSRFIERLSLVGKYTLYIYVFHSTPIFATWYMNIISKLANGSKTLFLMISIITVFVLFVVGCIVGIDRKSVV